MLPSEHNVVSFHFYRRNITLSLVSAFAMEFSCLFRLVQYVLQHKQSNVLRLWKIVRNLDFSIPKCEDKDTNEQRAAVTMFCEFSVLFACIFFVVVAAAAVCIIFRLLSIQSFVHFRLSQRYVFTSNRKVFWWCLFLFNRNRHMGASSEIIITYSHSNKRYTHTYDRIMFVKDRSI